MLNVDAEQSNLKDELHRDGSPDADLYNAASLADRPSVAKPP